MSKSSYANTITDSFTNPENRAVTLTGDALARPTNDDLISGALAFWPTGAAWGSPDGEALSLDGWLARFTRVLIAPFAFLYARSWQLLKESSTQTLSETLDEWEAEYGLPERCFVDTQTTAQRLVALKRKVASEPVNHPEDFVRLAADYGFTIEIEEPCLFECGFSECGGQHTPGVSPEETYWIVRVKDSSVSYFEAGLGECGYDPLFDLGIAEQILCLLRKMAPAWTLPVLAPWINYGYLSDGLGRVITDGYGNPILIPLNS